METVLTDNGTSYISIETLLYYTDCLPCVKNNFWLRYSLPTGVVTIPTVIATVEEYSSSYEEVARYILAITDTWAPIKITHNVSSLSVTKIRVLITPTLGTGAEIHFKDSTVEERRLTVTQKSGSTPVEILNPNFETNLANWYDYYGTQTYTNVTWQRSGAKFDFTTDTSVDSLWQNIGETVAGDTYQLSFKTWREGSQKSDELDSTLLTTLQLEVRIGGGTPAASALLSASEYAVTNQDSTEMIYTFTPGVTAQCWIGFSVGTTQKYISFHLDNISVKHYNYHEGLCLLDRMHSRMASLIATMYSFCDPDSMPASLIDFQLYHFGISAYQGCSDTKKRNLLKLAYSINAKRYTNAGLTLLYTTMSSEIDAVYVLTKYFRFLSFSRNGMIGFANLDERYTLGNTKDLVPYLIGRSTLSRSKDNSSIVKFSSATQFETQYVDFLLNAAITDDFRDYLWESSLAEICDLNSRILYSVRFFLKIITPVVISTAINDITMTNTSFVTDLSGWVNYYGA